MKNETLGIIAVVLGVLILFGTGYLLANIPEPVKYPACPTCPAPVVIEKIVEVPTIVEVDYRQKVLDAVTDEISNDKALRICKTVKFDDDEISIKKIYDGYTFTENTDGESYINFVKVKLNYDDKCFRAISCAMSIDDELVCN